MSAHTPGPWEAVGCEVRTAVTAEDRRGWGVATTLHGTEPDRRHANAALIAAAPDLLAALRGLIGLERRNLLKDRAAKAWIGAAEAAIAKAEGRP